ncbi:MAG: hypothetical protein ACR2PR_07240 [Pseudohongiellaceae bacterium]
MQTIAEVPQTSRRTKKLASIILAALLPLLAGCCGMGSIFCFDPGYDVVVDESGNRMFTDTPRNWMNWVSPINGHIQREAAGEKAANASESWNVFWNYRIYPLKDGHRENSWKHINYIIGQRRLAGLPELVLLDMLRDESDKLLLADTPRYWVYWTETVHRHIQEEVAGKKTPDGVESWNVLWDRRIKAIKRTTENFQKYINYVIEQRNLAELPELILDDDGGGDGG